MENNATLNGFEAVFDVFNNTGADNDFGASETMTDEEIEALKNKDNKTVEKEDDEVKKETELDEDDEDEVVEEKPVKTKNTKSTKVEKPITNEEDEEELEEDESEHITSFFDALSEKIGWDDIDEEDKPKTAEELI
ncbi:hypothetical protein [Intestinibacter sp.]|uniref:hypothetical protein n=1 Tax=Intestinibacter sp. TaxID=1965304 RepID=UPI003F18F98F